MAIRRCPYCKAIIDEQDKYCNNCGTQLLFPEDEFVEEEIPGDKLLDKDEPEGAPDEDAGEERKLEDEEERVEDDDEDDHEDEDDDDEDKEEAEAEDVDKDEDLETEDEDEQENERQTAQEPDGDEEEDDEEDDEDEDDERDEDLTDDDEDDDAEEELEQPERNQEGTELDEPGAGTTGTGEYDLKKTGSAETLEDEPEVAGEEAEEDVEAIVGEEDRGLEPDRERDEEAAGEGDDLNGLAEVAREDGPSDELDKKYEVSIEDDELVIKTKAIPDTASLPPWANRIRETPATVEADEGTRGTSPLSREWTTDSGIGIPERVTQAALPFSDTGTQEVRPPAQETDHVEEETRQATAEVEEAGPAGGLSLKLRAKFVDWVFVTALWLISLWFTAQVVGVSLFRLLFGSPLQVLAFYLILLVLYFFLFLYFLGETLGDHYFSE